MTYSVQKIAQTAGISVRALHYYDEIGLLKPLLIKDNGYRSYGDKELAKLQQILFFRELEFPLSKIKEIMDSPKYDSVAALSDQKKLLELKRERVEKLIKTITTTIHSLKGGENMNNDDTFSAFNDPTYQKYKDEVEEKWGNTDAYKQSMQRVSKMSEEDLARIKKEGGDITLAIADLMKKGFPSDSGEVQEQIDLFYEHLHNFYDPSYEMFKGLGEVYVSDERFTALYEKIEKGLAVFMRDSMVCYAENKSK